MIKIVSTLFLLFVILRLGNASPQSDQFEKTGFSKKTIIGGSIQKTSIPSREFIDSFIEALQSIEPPKTKLVEHSYILSFLTGSSFESQKLTVFMDLAGNGYFQRGKDSPVYFYSSKLSELLEKQKKTEQDAAANP